MIAPPIGSVFFSEDRVGDIAVRGAFVFFQEQPTSERCAEVIKSLAKSDGDGTTGTHYYSSFIADLGMQSEWWKWNWRKTHAPLISQVVLFWPGRKGMKP